ncbi:thiamine phosphate synthase [Metasolibacillus sp. FSL H7-0170]|uniref:thiamine phosphate synthase n=1 Tax=Metasolibacillus TaxID=2703677 RepID=UPI0007983416|nr:thiamine phosphate synthase [Metasolibacillus fluoroglycofenilyticus]KYG91965.1 thiamine phosphate synthase [[Bacillus] sp. KCTC 13219]
MKREKLAVYFIMGTINCQREPLHILEEALQAGVTIFQLREKGEGALKGAALLEFAKRCQALCLAYDVPFIINDDIELALAIDADGVHVGQDDMKLVKIRQQLPDKIIGVSVHNEDEMQAAVAGGADYVGIGPIFATISKADANEPAGVAFLAKARATYPTFPIVAIGGITAERAEQVLTAGADGVAVISAICQSENIEETVKKFSSLQQKN